MNRQQAGGLLARLGAAFPSVTVTTDIAEVWFNSVLERVDPNRAHATAARIIAGDERFPTIARFSAVLRVIDAEQHPQRELAAAPADPDIGRQNLRHIRKALAAARAGHPCPECGWSWKRA